MPIKQLLTLQNLYFLNEQILIESRFPTNALSLTGYEDIQIPEGLVILRHLQQLTLNDFPSELPTWLTMLWKLKTLEINRCGNPMKLLFEINKLKYLQELKLSYLNDKFYIPWPMAKMKQLKVLNIDGALIDNYEHLSPIRVLSGLESFSFENSDCDLFGVIEYLAQLPHLKKLRLSEKTSFNILSAYEPVPSAYIPDNIYELTWLEEIDFHNWYYIQEISEEIGEMHNLRSIDLSNTDYATFYSQISELPETLFELPKLEYLNLYGQQSLSTLPANFSDLSSLKGINIIKSGIKKLHFSTHQLNTLKDLGIQGHLPDFRFCENLKRLEWQIEEIGSTKEFTLTNFTCLQKLEELSIISGKLIFPEFLLSFRNLRSLSLICCGIDYFPKNIDILNKLESIFIRGAENLENLPDAIGRLPKLKKLHIEFCNIRSLPKTLHNRYDVDFYIEDCPINKIKNIDIIRHPIDFK